MPSDFTLTSGEFALNNNSSPFGINTKDLGQNQPEQPSGPQDQGNPSLPQKPVLTQGIIDQSDPNMMNISGNGAVISIRDGNYVGIAEGTTAWAGSKILAYGDTTVELLTGTQKLEHGQWIASPDATFTYNPEDAARIQKEVTEYFNNAGFTTGELNFTLL